MIDRDGRISHGAGCRRRRLLASHQTAFSQLENRPDKVAVVGSGYIAVELAVYSTRSAADVTQFVRFNGVLRSFDSMLGEKLRELMRESGVEIVTGATPVEVKKESSLTLVTEDGRRFDGFDCVLWAVGRDAEHRIPGTRRSGSGDRMRGVKSL